MRAEELEQNLRDREHQPTGIQEVRNSCVWKKAIFSAKRKPKLFGKVCFLTGIILTLN